MSRSHNTKPLRLDDWHDRSDRHKFWRNGTYVRCRSREYNRQDRHNARADLRKAEEPEPVQGRSRAIWDAW